MRGEEGIGINGYGGKIKIKKIKKKETFLILLKPHVKIQTKSAAKVDRETTVCACSVDCSPCTVKEHRYTYIAVSKNQASEHDSVVPKWNRANSTWGFARNAHFEPYLRPNL